MMQTSYRQFPQQAPQRSPLAPVARRGIGPMVSGAHAQPAMMPTQMQNQQEAQRREDQAKRVSERKPVDKNIPDGVEECVIGDGVQRYKELRDIERKLDAAMMRKRLDILESRNRNVRQDRTLRLWISNTVEDQPWQGDSLDVDAFDFSTNMDASYRVKIEGRLLDVADDEDESDDEEQPEQDADVMDEDGKEKKSKKAQLPKQRYKFSHFFKALTVDFDRSRMKDGAEQTVEWKKPAIPSNTINLPNAADFDQLEFKRGGDENINITINLVRDETFERYMLSPTLAEIMDTTEATRAEAVTGIWEYIKAMGLQEDDEKRLFRCDDLLKVIFQRDTGYIPYILDAIVPHMSPLPPIKLLYTIRVDQEFHKDPQPTIYDINVSIDDPLRAKLQAFNQKPSNGNALREIAACNDELADRIRQLAKGKARHNFFTSLSKDPGNFMRKWMSSQKRDLEVVLGDATRGGGEEAGSEEWRRGGQTGVWGTENVRESVNLMLASRPR